MAGPTVSLSPLARPTAALGVRLRDGKELRFTLPADSLFEDLEARVADLDGDGRDEIMVVRSRQDSGASLLILGVRDGAIRALAESPAIGVPNRWLNPLGAADVDGDGRPDVLAVLTPHIGGTLVGYAYGGDRLTENGGSRDFRTTSSARVSLRCTPSTTLTATASWTSSCLLRIAASCGW